MSDRIDDDLLDETDEAEGPVGARHSYDDIDELTDIDEGDDDAGDDEGDEYETDDVDAYDELEDGVADALEAEDADEFFRRLRRIARRVAPVIGRIARTVAPIASAIPLPQAQLIGRVAGAVGRVLADDADEWDAYDEVVDLAEDEDSIDAAAPVLAGLAIRSAMRGAAARLPRPVRRQLVRTVSTATRQIARRHGPRAAAAVPAIVRQARRAVAQRGAPARTLPRAVRRTAARVLRSPQAVRRLTRVAGQMRQAATGQAPGTMRRGRMGAAGGTGALAGRAYGSCPSCGRRHTFSLRGPVRITIRQN